MILYAFLSAAIISLISFVGALTLFFSAERLRRFVFILVGLAVGTLFGDTFLHIIPEINKDQGFTTSTGFLIMAGFLLFFVMEKLKKFGGM